MQKLLVDPADHLKPRPYPVAIKVLPAPAIMLFTENESSSAHVQPGATNGHYAAES